MAGEPGRVRRPRDPLFEQRAQPRIALLTFDEGALLFQLARESSTIVEIGRFNGGSTLLLAAAMPPTASVWSYDMRLKLAEEIDAAGLDRELEAALGRYGLAERVHLVVGDSRTAAPPPRPCDLVFVDGDHSYEGTCGDYDAWAPRIAPGGHLLFHDFAVMTPHEGVRRAVAEVDTGLFDRLPGAGSLAHFRRR